MHMADALLSPAVGGVMYAASAGAIACAAARIKRDELSDSRLPVMAVAGAFVFAAQMINFTIPGTGSSGHIGGGILLSALLGGGPALLTLSAVLIIQCLFFADGGLLALGCNIFNMGVIPCLLAYPLVYRPLTRKGLTPRRITLACLLSVVLGLQLGAFGVVLETTASGVTALPFGAFVALMQPIHLAIGLGEGIATAAVLCFVRQLRPELLESAQQRTSVAHGASVKRVVAVLAVAALVVGGGVSYLASSHPDGLEWAMERVAGTADLASDSTAAQTAASIQEATAFLPDYGYAGTDNPSGTAVSGVVGAGLTFALAGCAGLVVSKVKRRRAA